MGASQKQMVRLRSPTRHDTQIKATRTKGAHAPAVTGEYCKSRKTNCQKTVPNPPESSQSSIVQPLSSNQKLSSPTEDINNINTDDDEEEEEGEEEVKVTIKKLQKGAIQKVLKIFSLNVNSLVSKLNVNILQAIVIEYDVLCFQECKLDVCDEINVDLKGYKPYYNSRKEFINKSGGQAIFAVPI